VSRARQKQQSDEVRTHILDIAARIIAEEGIEALSIRRITKEMDYSAGIVYHYFDNKEQIIHCVLQEGYNKILSAIKPSSDNLPPDEAIRASFIKYIEGALLYPTEYKAVMLSSSSQILDFTSVLGEGIYEKRPALAALMAALDKGVSEGLFAPCDTQATAQAMWASMFGLLIRLIVEKDVSQEQRVKIIERQTDILLKGLQP
jgi:AcrR family transcriptional regulator